MHVNYSGATSLSGGGRPGRPDESEEHLLNIQNPLDTAWGLQQKASGEGIGLAPSLPTLFHNSPTMTSCALCCTVKASLTVGDVDSASFVRFGGSPGRK